MIGVGDGRGVYTLSEIRKICVNIQVSIDINPFSGPLPPSAQAEPGFDRAVMKRSADHPRAAEISGPLVAARLDRYH